LEDTRSIVIVPDPPLEDIGLVVNPNSKISIHSFFSSPAGSPRDNSALLRDISGTLVSFGTLIEPGSVPQRGLLDKSVKYV
jgi:hypothetical protein